MASTVSAAKVSREFSAYQHDALREPVIITEDGEPRTVLMAYADFLRLSQLERSVDLTHDLSADELLAVEKSEMDESLTYLDAELGRPDVPR